MHTPKSYFRACYKVMYDSLVYIISPLSDIINFWVKLIKNYFKHIHIRNHVILINYHQLA